MIEIYPADNKRIGDLDTLFALDESADRCWCMWFIVGYKDFHALGRDGNRASLSVYPRHQNAHHEACHWRRRSHMVRAVFLRASPPSDKPLAWSSFDLDMERQLAASRSHWDDDGKW